MIRWVLGISACAILLLAAYGAYVLIRGAVATRPATLEANLERALTERVSDKIAAALTFDPRLASLHVVPIEGDPRDLLRGALEERLKQKGFVGIEEDASSLARKLRHLAGGEGGEEGLLGRLRAFLNQSAGAEFTEEEALEFGRSAGVSALLLAHVTENGEVVGQRRYSVTARVVDVESGADVLPASEFGERIPLRISSLDYLSIALQTSSPWGRILVWIAFVIALPFLLLPLVRRVLDRESNGANFLLLVGLSGAGLLLVWILLGFRVAGGLAFGALLGGGVLALAYNFLVCTAVEKLARS